VATEIAAIENRVASAVAPPASYSPSWIDRFVDWLERLPGPTWAAWLAFLLLGFLATTIGGWASGTVRPGVIDPVQSSYAIFLVAPFLVVRTLDRSAIRSLGAFAPSLDVDEAQLAGIAYRLTTIPARPALLIGIAGIALDALTWISDPAGAQVQGPPYAIAGRAVLEFTIVAAWLGLTFGVIRQLRLVTQLHAQATHIDLFRQAPLHAFSHLTVRVGIAFIIVSGLSLLITTPEQLVQPFTFSFLAATVVVGVASFVVPLLGLHRRLAAEKAGLVDGANDRLKVTMSRLHEGVDGGDMALADQIQKTLTSLLQERDVLDRLPTWPFDPGTLRAFASAIALPIALWLVTRALERVI
jgi:hypothetical protein